MKVKLLAILALMFTTSTATLLTQSTSPDASIAEREKRKEARAEIRKELKAYRKEVIQPERLKARRNLETAISVTDRTELERLRELMKTRPKPATKERPVDKDARKEMRKDMHEQREAWRTDHAADFEGLDRIIEKYADKIAEAQKPLDELRPEWEAYRKSVIEKHRGERKEKGEKAKKGRKHPRHRHAEEAGEHDGLSHEELKERRQNRLFLLMNPDKQEKRKSRG